jgi:hypothetical protein
VSVTAVHQRVLAEDVLDRSPERLTAVDDEQDRLLGVQAAVDEVGEQHPRKRRVLSRAFPEPKRDLDALGADAERDDWQRSAISMPSSIITARRTSSSRRPISSDSALAVRSTNSSEIVHFEVAVEASSTSAPTGSPTWAYLRVETPASIRSITARVSGSRSAKYSYVATGSSCSSSAVRIRGRRTGTRRPPSVIEPDSLP